MNLAKYIRDIPDFPKPGILFKDITPLLNDPAAFHEAIDCFIRQYGKQPVDAIAAAEARGFFAVARLVGLAFAPPVFEADRPEADLDDFFRVFLDIRLPFVAFGGVFRDS